VRPRRGAVAEDDRPIGQGSNLRAIQDVADELGVTSRTIRFYEDRGLIAPQRVGTMRVYSRREVARLRLILRGKRLGFSIREIAEFLDLYDADPEHVEQMRRLVARIDQRLEALRLQQEAIDQTRTDLAQLRDIAGEKIASVEDIKPV
jgi:DNA-binding transcriptional MerR regulator